MPRLLAALKRLMVLPEFQSFRLVGGTSLALQLGHRMSVDIDLFTDAPFDSKAKQFCLAEAFPSFELAWQNDNGFSAYVDDVKIDCFNWRVRFLEPALIVDEIRLLSLREISAMKLETVTDRKEKKDFVDLFFLLRLFPLKEIIEAFRAKYPFIGYKFALESLLAIDLADKTEMPSMFEPFDWEEAKSFITRTVQDYVAENQSRAQQQQQDRLRKAEDLLRNKKKDD